MKHELPPLPYPVNALEPHFSAETLEYHHGRHHRKYVDDLNALIEGTEYEDMPLERIIADAGEGPIFNNAAQVWNHSFYWHCLSPDGGGRPGGNVGGAIESSFNSFDALKERFTEAAVKLFGSGWVWLVKNSEDSVSIDQTKDGSNPLAYGRIAVLACDVWEHAYYIDYRNDKARYMEAFWNVVNWDFVAKRLKA